MSHDVSPLPSLQIVQLDPDGLSVWRVLLRAEAAFLNNPSKTAAKYPEIIVGIRILGFLLKDFWDHQKAAPYQRLLLEIKSCLNVPDAKVGSAEEVSGQHKNLYTFGLHYRSFLFPICE